MADVQLTAVRQWLQDHRAELLADTQAMLRIPSIEGDPEPNAPYGKANRAALDLALDLAKQAGMKTTDLEGHIGYGEFGSGAPLIVSLGHLDVVPTGPGWKHDPFGAEIDGDYVYARGATDDKGPTMASFYAMRAILATCPELGVRFRQVFGCNEESGFRCVERYVQTEEAPTFGVAPDSGWPCYHAEKGIANLEIDIPIGTRALQIVEISGGDRPNIVIDRCAAKVKVASAVRAELESKLEDAWDRNVTFAWEGDVLGVFAIGKAAHGSTPFRGDSAATRVLRFLAEIAPVEDEEFYDELLEMSHPGGAGLGISGSDAPSRDLTANLGVISSDPDHIHLLVNVRYPVTWTGTELSARCQAYLDRTSTGGKLVMTRDSAPLYFPLEHPLVKTIVDVCEAEFGERLEPGTMGGGTYARAIPNTVSIGTGFAGDGKAHETDERLKVDHLYRMSEVYAHIFLRLAREAVAGGAASGSAPAGSTRAGSAPAGSAQ